MNDINDPHDYVCSSKVAAFFTASQEVVQQLTAMKSAFPGVDSKSCLLLDYLPKIRDDVNDVKQIQKQERISTRTDRSLQEQAQTQAQPAAKLAAELVLESVQREAELRIRTSTRSHRSKKTLRPP